MPPDLVEDQSSDILLSMIYPRLGGKGSLCRFRFSLRPSVRRDGGRVEEPALILASTDPPLLTTKFRSEMIRLSRMRISASFLMAYSDYIRFADSGLGGGVGGLRYVSRYLLRSDIAGSTWISSTYLEGFLRVRVCLQSIRCRH